jgi:hypothetical protein
MNAVISNQRHIISRDRESMMLPRSLLSLDFFQRWTARFTAQ